MLTKKLTIKIYAFMLYTEACKQVTNLFDNKYITNLPWKNIQGGKMVKRVTIYLKTLPQ